MQISAANVERFEFSCRLLDVLRLVLVEERLGHSLVLEARCNNVRTWTCGPHVGAAARTLKLK